MKKTFILTAISLFMAFAGNSQAVEVDLLGNVDVHGFVSQGYMRSQHNNYLANDSSDGTFAFNEIGINFSKQLTDRLRIGLQLFSRDLGQIGNNEIELDWALADYRWKDWLGLRAGKIKLPFGLYNETRDIDALRTSIFLPQSVYPEIYRATNVAVKGAGIYGNVPINSLGSLSYNILAGTTDISGDNDNGMIREINGYGGIEVSGDLDVGEIYAGGLEWQTPLEGLLLKTTLRRMDWDIPSETTDTSLGLPAGTSIKTKISKLIEVVYSVEYTWEDLVLAAECYRMRSQPEIFVSSLDLVVPQEMSKRLGYYYSAAYRFSPLFEAGTYYSKWYTDRDDKDGSEGGPSGQYVRNYQGWLEDYALSLRFDINEYWVCKLEGHRMNGAAFCLGLDNDDFDDHWYMLAAKLSFSF